MDGFEKLRPVGRLERYSTARHHLRFYLGVAVTATYTLPAGSCSVPLKNYIYAACGTLIGQHPSLSAIAVDEDTNDPQFVRLPQIRLDECVQFENRRHNIPDPSAKEYDGRDGELDELLSAQHNIPFTAPLPFWRLCILTDPSNENPSQFTAAFVYHHVIGDGMSGAAFHRTFYRALSQAIRQPPPKDLPADMVNVPSPQIPLLPNLEAIHPLSVSWLHLITVVFREKLWRGPRNPGLWTGNKISTPLESQVRALHIPASTTGALTSACREKGTTVGAALQTLIAGALFIHLPEEFTELKCGTPLSMRRWLSHQIVPKDEPESVNDCIGVWVQESSEQYSRDKFSSHSCLSWDEARRTRGNIELVLNRQGYNSDVGLLRYVRNYHQELFQSKIGQERDISYEVSNLGAFRTSSKSSEETGPDNLEIGQMMFSQGGGVTGSGIGVGVITGEDGCLGLSFSHQKGIVGDDLVEKVVETVRKELLHLETDQS